MTIHGCHEALTSPVSQYDARARIKMGFRNSVRSQAAKLKSELGDVADLSDENLQRIERLSKKAASVWLKFSMYRCRIVIRLTGSEPTLTEEKVARAETKSLVLTRLPQVGRFGKVTGKEIETFMIIDGCAGDALKLS